MAVQGAPGRFTTSTERSRLMASHNERFRWRDLVTREYPLEEAAQALEDLEALADAKAVIRP